MRIVAKIGTASVTDERGRISHEAIAKLVREVAELSGSGHELIVVSSGAVAAGVAALGMRQRPAEIQTLQAVAAAGQARLVHAYDRELARYGLVAAQLLVDPYDFVERTQYLHLRSTLAKLLELGAVPIVNENDAIANDELRYGDNDRIAALVANSVRADVLVLLTDMDGVYTADPRTDPDARLIPWVAADDPLLAVDAGGGGSGRGSGGMASKLTAARMASWSGIRSVIARASHPGILAGAASEELVGTTFAAHDRSISARKLWIAFAAEVVGRVHVDAGARRALVEGRKSLLPAGVVAVDGHFDAGEVIDVVDPDGVAFARGRTSAAAAQLRPVVGQRTGELPSGMVHEVVHRDDLVVLEPVTAIGSRFNPSAR